MGEHSVLHTFYPVTTPGDLTFYDVAKSSKASLTSSLNTRQASAEPPSPPISHTHAGSNIPQSRSDPVVHAGIVCDGCSCQVIGVRHKCLDCPDFDLCDSCVASGGKESHEQFHEFFEITEPGHVYVHTIFSGDAGREPVSSQTNVTTPVQASEGVRPPTVEPVIHGATCNLCDSRIRGVRYVCILFHSHSTRY